MALAQEGVLQTHPAGPSDGKYLSPELIERSREVRPSAGSREIYTTLEKEGITFDTPKGPVFENEGNSLYWKLEGGERIPVAISESSQIVYGQTVSRNEFGISGGVFPSPDGEKVAFYRKDESRVTDFPHLDITTRTGSLVTIKYPMNGMESERITLGVFDRTTRRTVWMDVRDFGEDRYLTNVSWGPDSRYIFIQVLDRSQKHMRLNQYSAGDGHFVRTILTEDCDKYVEPLDPLHFIGEGYQFIYRTNNRDNYRNLYLCDTLGTVRRLTEVDADVKWVGFNGKEVLYTSAEVSPIENHLFKIPVTFGKGKHVNDASRTKVGKAVRLTFEQGWHSILLASDGTHFLDSYSSFNVPRVVTLKSTDPKVPSRTLFESPDPLKDYCTGKVVLGTVKSADGKYDNYYRMFFPKDFDPSKKYPVMLYVYGGPHSQMVTDTWLGGVRLLEPYMAQKGYIVYVQDGRGTENRGREFEQEIHRRCGQKEMEDQMVGIDMLRQLPYVDPDRIGVHGWSYGGFMTISLMTHYPDVFKVGVAGGPVIDWKWYEIMYGERYMETEATNPEGMKECSLIERAGDLKGKLLICQGAVDDVVVWEHSLSFVQACIDKNIQLDYFPYPLSQHNVAGPNRVHLTTKIANYFFDHL